MKKFIVTNEDIHVALLQIRSTPLEPGLLSPATLLFNHPILDIISIINRLPINSDNEDEHYEVLINRQAKMTRNMILSEGMIYFQWGLL